MLRTYDQFYPTRLWSPGHKRVAGRKRIINDYTSSLTVGTYTGSQLRNLEKKAAGSPLVHMLSKNRKDRKGKGIDIIDRATEVAGVTVETRCEAVEDK